MATLQLVSMFVLGAILASFAGVIAGRLNTGQSWARGRSRCDACARTLALADLFPVLSWLASGGRCRGCGARIPVASPLGEAALGAAFAWAYLSIGFAPALLPFLAALVVLCALVLYDLAHTIVPPGLSALLALLALAYAAVATASWASFGLALAIAGAIALALALLHLLSGGRAMGLGDAPVAFSLSLLAAPYALAGLAFSFWIGAAVGVLILAGKPRGQRAGTEVPFVPFLAAGFLLACFTHINPFPW